MRRKLLLGAAPLLAAATLLAVPRTSDAQGFSFGNRNFGVTIGQPYYGGYGYGGYGYGGYGYNRGYGYSSGWYGNYPYASRYYGGYAPYQSYYSGSPAYSSGYYPSYGSYSSPAVTNSYPATSYQSFYPQATTQTDQNAARMRLRVPENARVWFDDTETQQRGMDREFVSPALTPGKQYVYQIKAQWQENGRDVIRQKQVTVRAGEALNVDLMAEAAEPRGAVPAANPIPRDRDADAAGQPPKPAPPANDEKPRENPAAAPPNR